MNDETTIPQTVAQEEAVPAIRDEDQFQDAIIKEKEKSEKSNNSDRFVILLSLIHI